MVIYVLFFYIHSLVGFDDNEQNGESGKYPGVTTIY